MKDVGKKESLNQKRGMSIETMINGLEPDYDLADRRILFDVTGIKLDQNDYQDESSLNDEDSELDQDAFNESRSQSLQSNSNI